MFVQRAVVDELSLAVNQHLFGRGERRSRALLLGERGKDLNPLNEGDGRGG